MRCTLALFWPPQSVRQEVGLRGVQAAEHLDDIVYHKDSVIVAVQYPLVAAQACTGTSVVGAHTTLWNHAADRGSKESLVGQTSVRLQTGAANAVAT